MGQSKRIIDDRYKDLARRGGHASEYVGATAAHLAERIFATAN